VEWRIDMNRGRLKAIAEDTPKKPKRRAERLKAQIHDRFERRCYMVNNLLGHRKVRYQGLSKNTATCFTLFARANLALPTKHFLA
jgi:IS5 family transposase